MSVLQRFLQSRAASRMRLSGHGVWVIHEPGRIVAAGGFDNLITATGDLMYAQRGGGVAGAPNAPTGMRLGSGITVPAKTGSLAVVVSYIAGSTIALASGYPVASIAGSAQRITYRCTWPPGTATHSSITEVVLTNQSGPTEGAGVAGNTVARALLGAAVVKTSGQALTIDWHHDTQGA